jgi:uncharacterized protein DUF4184
MPFTLAHPAAILPLRGIRYLRTAPLVIGALVPDLPYYAPAMRTHLHPDTHSVAGVFTTDLVLGCLTLAGVFVLRRPLTALLTPRARGLCLGALRPFTRWQEWAAAPLAILVGVLSHLLWDSFTHENGWMVRRVALLSAPVTLGPYTGTLCHVLQYLSSAFGLAVLALWYRRLPAPPTHCASGGGARSAALPVLLLVAAAALLIGGVQATETFARGAQVYRTLGVFLTHGLAWFALLYLIAGTILTLEQTHERAAAPDGG